MSVDAINSIKNIQKTLLWPLCPTSTFCLTWTLGKGDAVDAKPLAISLPSNQTSFSRYVFNSSMLDLLCWCLGMLMVLL